MGNVVNKGQKAEQEKEDYYPKELHELQPWFDQEARLKDEENKEVGHNTKDAGCRTNL